MLVDVKANREAGDQSAFARRRSSSNMAADSSSTARVVHGAMWRVFRERL